MGWDRARSEARIKGFLDGIGEIEIEPMTRTMDLENLSETKCREITGTHLYSEIANLPALVNEVEDEVERKRLVQAIHVFQREAARIIAAVDGDRIHFQAARVHALIYRPISATDVQARNAVLIQLMLDRYGRVFAAAYPELPAVQVRSGSDHGKALGTRNGQRGDRELLFLGSPANQAAKLLPSGRDRRLTPRVYDLLPADLQELASDDGDANSLSRPSSTRLAELLAKYKIDWSEEAAKKRLDDDKKALPLNEIELAGARTLIAFDDLTPRKSKYVLGATVYADVSGFTAYVEGAKDRDAQRERLRNFHVIRKEMAAVIKGDFGAIRVQYQGDRAQGFIHLPDGDSEAIAGGSVDIAAGLQSSFEETLKAALTGIDTLGLAVGIGQGETIATKLGERGHRDRICLGSAVSRGERNEERVGKQDVGIDSPTFNGLAPEVQATFSWDASAGCYVAHGLRVASLEKAKTAAALSKRSVHVGVSGGVVVVNPTPRPGLTPVVPARSWSDEALDTAKVVGLVVVASSILATTWLAIQRFLRTTR